MPPLDRRAPVSAVVRMPNWSVSTPAIADVKKVIPIASEPTRARKKKFETILDQSSTCGTRGSANNELNGGEERFITFDRPSVS